MIRTTLRSNPRFLAFLAVGLAWAVLGGCGSDPAVNPPVPTADPLPKISDGGADSGEKAPDKYLVKFETSKGNFVIEVDRSWAPRGADRFHELITGGFYDGNKFFRVVKGFMVQWGIHGNPLVSSRWRDKVIRDDEVKQSNRRGHITFATSGKDSRTTQVFINFVDNPRLDGMGFSPFGKVIRGMEVVDSLYGEYGESPSQEQGEIQAQGNLFLMERYPKLDSIRKARIVTLEELDDPTDGTPKSGDAGKDDAGKSDEAEKPKSPEKPDADAAKPDAAKKEDPAKKDE